MLMRLSQKECVRHLRELDVLMLGSLFECGGVTAITLPIVATARGGPSDYLCVVRSIRSADLPQGFCRWLRGGDDIFKPIRGTAD